MYNGYMLHTFQPQNSEKLCEALVEVAQQHAPNLLEDAKIIGTKFRQAFGLFSCCHLVYDSSEFLDDTTINELGTHAPSHTTCDLHDICIYMYMYMYTCIHTKSYHSAEINIDRFLTHYRETFPEASVTPKFHMLEDHAVPFLRRWRVGFGFHGEQGAESLHATFNKISRSYTAIRDRVERLKCIVKEHHLQVSPTLVAQEPPVKKKISF